MNLFQTVRMGQKLEILDIQNTQPGPIVSGVHATLAFILTGKQGFIVQELPS